MIIRIKNLRLRTIVGVHEFEQRQLRDILVNVELEFDGSAAARTDDLTKAIDYADLADRLTKHAAASRCSLLERLANEMLEIILADKRVRSATVEVDKPGAIPTAESVSVTATKTAEN
ncbi:MAG: dihydroneopterin aldolase [Phycisphaerae bacterium]|nr:dihydroneopterin aldolase [Phycisphaerae bacterium]